MVLFGQQSSRSGGIIIKFKAGTGAESRRQAAIAESNYRQRSIQYEVGGQKIVLARPGQLMDKKENQQEEPGKQRHFSKRSRTG